MPFHTKHVLVLTLACTLPVLNAADDEWRNLYSLGINATALHDFAKADAVFARALHDALLFGKDNPRVGTVLVGMVSLQRQEKHLPEAEGNARRAVEIFDINPGDGSTEYGQAEFALAGVLMDQGKYQLAHDTLVKALPLLEAHMGLGDVTTADATCMQGDTDLFLKMYASAEPLLKRCADLRADRNGVNTAEFGDAANSLALVYQRLGQYKQADLYFNYAAKIREITLGIMSPQLADTLEAYALLLRQLGRDGEASDKQRMAAAIRAHAAKK